MKRLFQKLLLSVAVCVVFVGLVEIMFRSIRYDFAQQEKRIEGYPIYYRYAREPTGEVFFRRKGPDGHVQSRGV